MKIQIMSDIHIEYSPYSPSGSSADVVVLAGDIGVGSTGVNWAKENFSVPVLYVSGNHEFHDPMWSMDEHKTQMNEAAKDSNVNVLDNTIAEFDNVRFLGTTLWSDAEIVLYPDADNITIDDNFNSVNAVFLKNIFEQNVEWLRSEIEKPFSGKTVVISHHAPSFRSVHPDYANSPINQCFVSDLERLMRGVDVWVHGHTHNSFDYYVNNTRVICNPRGYLCKNGETENKAFNDSFVIDL